MTKHVAGVSAIGAALVLGSLAFAGPAAAASDETVEMPDVRGMSLAQAQAAVAGLSDDIRIPTGSLDMNGLARQQLSPANWTVCATAPRPGASFNPEEGVLFGVVRRGLESC
jgi:beta-lactam-binding protein with PASTA domain